MNLPTIGGREFVPVRLIPFLTDWMVLSPDVVAALFAGQHPWHKWSLSAYRLGEKGAPEEIKAASWDHVILDIADSERAMKGAQHAEWRRRSLNDLPAGWFCWRDELAADYARTYGRITYPAGHPCDDDLTDVEVTAELDQLVDAARLESEAQTLEGDFGEASDRAPGRALDFAPPLDPEEVKVVYQGFANALEDGQVAAEDLRDWLRATRPMEVAMVGSEGIEVAPPPRPVQRQEAQESSTETPQARRIRRLGRFKELGGEMRKAGDGWQSSGTRGALAALVREEAESGRPMSDKTDVRDGLIAAMEDQRGS